MLLANQLIGHLFWKAIEADMAATVYTIDAGNSYTEVGVFLGDDFKGVHDLADDVVLSEGKGSVVYSAVGKKRNFPGVDIGDLFSRGGFLGMPVRYAKTLGADRLALGRYVYEGGGTEPTLVVDVGTFITVDLITDGGFMGGVILPGLEAYSASFLRGARLPRLAKEGFASAQSTLRAQTTQEALVNGLRLWLEGLVRVSGEKVEKIYLTGGDMDIVSLWLPEAISVRHLIHFALKKIHGLI